MKNCCATKQQQQQQQQQQTKKTIERKNKLQLESKKSLFYSYKTIK
jgi:hypothetical protein